MNIIYVEDMSESYMILSEEQQQEMDYQVQMLERNEILGLLPVRVKQVDSQLQYYYEISGKQQFGKWLEENRLSYYQVKKLMQALSDTIGQLECYLLSEQCLMLDQEYIYIEVETWDVSFCYYPPMNGKNRDEIQSLVKLILKKIDHRDPEAVFLAYGLFQESLNDIISLKRIQTIMKQKEPEEWKYEKREKEFDPKIKKCADKKSESEKQEETLEDKEKDPYIPLKNPIPEEKQDWNVPEQLDIPKTDQKLEKQYSKGEKCKSFVLSKKIVSAEKLWMAVPFLTLLLVIIIFSGKIIPIQKMWAKYPWICMGILLFVLGVNFIIIKRWYFDEENE